MEGTNPWFMLGLAAVLLAAVVIIFTFHEKSNAQVYEEEVDAVSTHVGYHLSLQWSLIEEVMLRFEHDSVVKGFFEKYPPEDLEQNRAMFFMFCLRAMPDFGEIEMTYLTKEFVEAAANRHVIASLPGHLRRFYETEASIRDKKPMETIIETGGGTFSRLTMSEEDLKRWQDQFLCWIPVDFPADESECRQELALLLTASCAKEVILRFRKKPPKHSTPRGFKLPSWRPVLSPIGG